MTPGQHGGTDDGVLERDDHTCRRCGTTADEDPRGLRRYPVGEPALDGPVHESALVTVCSGCYDALCEPPSGEGVTDAATLFDHVKTTTEREGVTVSAVAAFASLVTGVPDAIESADDPDTDSIGEIGAEYRQARREVLLAIDSVDASLEPLHDVDHDALEPSVADALGEFTGTTTKLQSELRGIVALGETVVAGLDRCPGCFDPLVPGNDRCAVCGLEPRDTSDWEDADGTVAFESLYDAINETLQTASNTTEALTERTTAVAEQLRDA
ncbi:hypothetical protein [Halopiger goleimassiliensis]|uniref:hypothetical protein n=1 Tax=Halopiger goleimassiliensis TaxID=1293048 RepID=UPI000677D682|nr:hypothetical protein [Halopiger goleimassiliensis]